MAPDLRLCIVMLGLVCLNGCLGTHRVETSVYEGSEGAVFLRAVPVESRAASHPATLSIDTLKKVLQGIHFRQSGRLLQSLLNRDAAPTPLFSPSDVKLFAPHLQRAFSRATGRESVVVRMPAPSSSAFKTVTGTMVVNENTLHVAFTFSNKGSFTQTQSKVTPTDHRGFISPTFVFLPKDAVLKEAESPWYTNAQTRHRLLVNLSLITSAEGASFARDKEPAHRTPFEAQGRQKAVRPLVVPNATPSATTAPSRKPTTPPIKASRSSTLPSTTPTPKPDDSSSTVEKAKDLLEEIRSLRRELFNEAQPVERSRKRKAAPR